MAEIESGREGASNAHHSGGGAQLTQKRSRIRKAVGKRNRKSGKEKKGIWPVTYRWVAVGTLVAYTAIGSHKVAIADAQQAQASPQNQSRQPAQAVQPAVNFDIPPGLLGDVVDAFHDVTGLEIVVTNEGIRSLSSPGVSGLFTPEQALQHLLSGTGVSYRLSANLVRLNLAAASQSVTVNASDLQSDQVASPKYTAPILDTPQTIAVVPQQIMSEENTTTLTDALRNVPGISLAAGEGSSQGNNLTIRGFTARDDIFLDGMRDFGSYYRDTFDFDEVQILEGPSAVTFGRGTTSGVVSEVSKTPGLTPFIAGNFTGGSDLTRRFAADIDEPIPQLGSGAAFRLNVMGDDNDVAGRDIAQYRRYGFAPALALGLDGPTRLIVSYFLQSEDDIPDYGIPWYFNGPAPVARHNYYGFQNANFLRTTDDIFSARLEHDAGHGITLREMIRYYHEGRDAQITEPDLTECVTSDVVGCITPSTPLSEIQVTRNQINVDSLETALDDQLDATFHFHTGSIRHTLVAGVEGIRETSDPTRYTISGVPTTSLLDPDESQPYESTGSTLSQQEQVTAYTFGVYALDTLSLGSKLDLVGGVRWDRFDANFFNAVGPAAYSQLVGLTSWRGALVYKPKPNGSIYFDAGNSFDPSAENLSLTAANTSTPPERTLTFEGGTKWDFRSGKLAVTGSVFTTNMFNVLEPDPTDDELDVLGGNERVNGFQAGIQGHITNRWEILSGYAFLDSYVVSSNYYPQSVGAELANVPRNTFNFWTTYRLPWRNFVIGGGGDFVDKRTASSTAPDDPATGLVKEVPGYWVFNAMARYPLGERTSLQLNLYNLTDKYYIDQVHPAHLVPGAAFTALVGLNFRF